MTVFDPFFDQQVELSEVTLHVVTAGDPEHPSIILLHGFPEFWYGWKEVAELLVTAGYHVVIPDQRGYNTSDKPFWIGNYRIDRLADDIAELIDWINKDRVYLAGHDWGAAVAWTVMTRHPDRIEQGVIVNVPHTRTFKQYLRQQPSQLRKSWYMFFFQLPLIPQLMLRLFGFRFLRRSLQSTSLPNTFTESDIEQYLQAWRHSGISGMINWYRAAFRRRDPTEYQPIDLPVRIIWGKQDRFLSAEMAELSLQWCQNGEVIFIEEATHWVLHEFSEKVAKLMIEFFH